MTRQIILISTLFLTQIALGQKNNLAKIPPHPPTKKEAKVDERNHNCIKKANKSFSARLKVYPFDITAQIALVSFDDSLPRQNDTICYSKLKEIKVLTITQVDKLTDILYNYGFSGPVYTMSVANCYNPRNAILFFDNNGKVFDFIEICFQCDRTRQSSEKISLGDMCDQKMTMLKKLFKEIGIEYGITKGLIADE